MRSFVAKMIVLGGVMLAPAAAAAPPLGPDWLWDETTDGGGDAGSTRGTAQVTMGTGPLQRIDGDLSLSFALVDFEDVYAIRVCDPSAFLASTAATFGGGASFDTMLWLFDRNPVGPSMFGLLANDDTAGVPLPEVPRSTITPIANDGSGAALVAPRVYFLGVSGVEHVPVSGGGEIFQFVVPTEISGPDGQGGAGLHTGWTTNAGPEAGTYQIALAGITFANLMMPMDCDGNGIHDDCDVAFGACADVNANGVPDACECIHDLDASDDVGFGDLLALLAAWGPCPGCFADFDCSGTIDFADLLALLSAWGPC